MKRAGQKEKRNWSIGRKDLPETGVANWCSVKACRQKKIKKALGEITHCNYIWNEVEVATGLPHTGRAPNFTKSAPTVSVPFEVLVNRGI